MFPRKTLLFLLTTKSSLTHVHYLCTLILPAKLLDDDSSHFLVLDMFIQINSTVNLASFTIVILMFYVDLIHAGTHIAFIYVKTILLHINHQGSANHAVCNYALHKLYPC